MVESAARRFRQDGYAATGWRRIVAEADAPWGSQSHHFPGGKEQLAEEAIALGGGEFRRGIARLLESQPPAEAIGTWATVASAELERSRYANGCPIATVVLETAHVSPALATASTAVLEGWQEEWSRALLRDGHDEQESERLAALVVAGIEGAFVLARAANSPEPIERVAAALAPVLRPPE